MAGVWDAALLCLTVSTLRLSRERLQSPVGKRSAHWSKPGSLSSDCLVTATTLALLRPHKSLTH
jgi:hypothetical protein